MIISKDQLHAAMLQWETQYRNGETRTAEEHLALPAEQVADEATDHLWSLLQAITQSE